MSVCYELCRPAMNYVGLLCQESDQLPCLKESEIGEGYSGFCVAYPGRLNWALWDFGLRVYVPQALWLYIEETMSVDDCRCVCVCVCVCVCACACVPETRSRLVLNTTSTVNYKSTTMVM